MTRKIYLFMEVPTAHLDELSPVIDGHFCIASKCLTDPAYYEWYRNKTHDQAVILDNGTHEERRPVSCDDLLEIAQAIRPDLVFAPDILCDRQQTMELSKEFCRRSVEAKSGWALGIVPQGSNNEELVLCYEEAAAYLLDSLDFAGGWLGMSLMDNRGQFIEEVIARRKGGLAPLPHHMLGLRNIAEIPDWPDEIIAMDTVKPLKAAHFGLNLEDCPRGLGVWDTSWVLDDKAKALCFRNIARLHAALTL